MVGREKCLWNYDNVASWKNRRNVSLDQAAKRFDLFFKKSTRVGQSWWL